jgi:hypothetical protein
MWPPGDKGELLLLLLVVEPVDFGEHTRRARFHQLRLEVVRQLDLLGDPLHDHRARLDAVNLVDVGPIEVTYGCDVSHIARHRYAELSLALVPGAELHHVALDLAQKLRVVRQPYVLESIQVAGAHALEHQAEVDLLDLDVPVT